MIKNIKLLYLAVILIVAVQCKYNDNKETSSNSGKQSLQIERVSTVEAQHFLINAKNDEIIEGVNGTILVCPKGCFKTPKGDIVTDSVKLDLIEALSLNDMLLSNLSTTSNGKLLKTDGMIYIKASANGQELIINPDIPIHIEIPTPNKQAGMMAYQGIVDSLGKINWINPQSIDTYLKIIDLSLLDFLPEGFRLEVEKGLPYKNHSKLSNDLVDSLYYSLKKDESIDLEFKTAIDTATNSALYNEAYYNKQAKVKNGAYTDDSYHVKQTNKQNKDSSVTYLGINPAMIKTIKSKKYQNTVIATKEFELRLKAVFKTGSDAVLEIYVKNLHRNLFEIDSLAAQYCKKNISEIECKTFQDFAKQKLTKVQDADKYASLLKGYFDKHLKDVTAQLNDEHNKYVKALQSQDKEAEKIANKYKKLLWKREKYRMETYGFNWTKTGWVNVDIGVLPKSFGKYPLNITVDNGSEFDRVYCYTVFTSFKSIYRLNAKNKEKFYTGNIDETSMYMPTKDLAVAVAIGYKDEKCFVAIKSFTTKIDDSLSMHLVLSSPDEIKKMIEPYENYKTENSISEDIKYMEKFYKEALRQKALIKEHEYITKLKRVAFRSWIVSFPLRVEFDK